MSTPATPIGHPLRKPLVQLAIVCALCSAALLAMVNRAFHIDDTIFLLAARQITQHPLDFYGFDINWEGTAERDAEVMKNPPLTSYYQAVVGALAGFHEVALHLAFLPFAIACIVLTFLLAQRFGAHPGLAALLVLLCPAFLVSACSVMSDVMMLAFWLATMWLWMYAVEAKRPAFVLLAGFCLALAILTKFPAINLLPLMLAYAVLHRRMLAWQAAGFAIPLVLVGLFEWYSLRLYGHGLLIGAGEFATGTRVGRSSLAVNLIVGLCFTGGGAIGPALAMLCFIRARGWLIAIAAGAVILLAVLSVKNFAGVEEKDFSFAAQVAVMSVLGGVLVVSSIVDAIRTRNADAIVLTLWIAGVFLFLSVVNWTANARSLLPAVPAVAIFAARRFQMSAPRTIVRTRALAAVCALAGVITLATAIADYRLANAFRTAAELIRQRGGGSPARIYFTGHWGFQWYMQESAAPLDKFQTRMMPGDLVVLMLKITDASKLPAPAVRLVDRLEIPVMPGLTTFGPELHAGFYYSRYGPLPYAFGAPPPERFEVYRVVAPISPASKPVD